VRYIGNKTRLAPFLGSTLRRLGIRPGTACDPFAGTASVGRFLKMKGWTVHSGDLMSFSYALQVTRVELDATPSFPGRLLHESGASRGRSRASYHAVLEFLQSLPPQPGFISTHFAPADGDGEGRRYFTRENAGAIDAVRNRIQAWSDDGALGRTQRQLLLASLIEAADRVANTTGVYASFVKSWQPNALHQLELRPLRPAPPRPEAAGACTSYLGPAEECVARVGPVDLLYLDPPYNERQYPAYYHVPELLAVGWNPPPPLRGKMGLIPDADRRSAWCRRREAEAALRSLVESLDARHLMLSYNDEGIIPADHIEEIFRTLGKPDSYRRFESGYKRYRSDADGPERRYIRDRVRERLHYVRLA